MIDILVATTPDKSSITAVAKQPVDPEKITSCLRRASQRTNHKLRDVAAELVASTVRKSTA